MIYPDFSDEPKYAQPLYSWPQFGYLGNGIPQVIYGIEGAGGGVVSVPIKDIDRFDLLKEDNGIIEFIINIVTAGILE